MTTEKKVQQQKGALPVECTRNDVNEVTQDNWNKFLSQVEGDIKNSKRFGGSEYEKVFSGQCVSARTAFQELQHHLMEETKELIEGALVYPEDEVEKRRKVGEAWERIYNTTIIRAKQILYPIQNVLAILCEKNTALSRKYKIWLTVGGTALVAGGAVAGVVLCHLLPAATCGFTLTNVLVAAGCGATVAAAIPYALGVLALIGIGIGGYLIYRGIRTKMECQRLVETRLKVRTWLLKYFPSFMKLTGNIEMKMTEEQLIENLKQLLMPYQIDKNTWVSNTILLSFKRDIEWSSREMSNEDNALSELIN